jgi:hypothetical protein
MDADGGSCLGYMFYLTLHPTTPQPPPRIPLPEAAVAVGPVGPEERFATRFGRWVSDLGIGAGNLDEKFGLPCDSWHLLRTKPPTPPANPTSRPPPPAPRLACRRRAGPAGRS